MRLAKKLVHHSTNKYDILRTSGEIIQLRILGSNNTLREGDANLQVSCVGQNKTRCGLEFSPGCKTLKNCKYLHIHIIPNNDNNPITFWLENHKHSTLSGDLYILTPQPLTVRKD